MEKKTNPKTESYEPMETWLEELESVYGAIIIPFSEHTIGLLYKMTDVHERQNLKEVHRLLKECAEFSKEIKENLPKKP